MGKKAVVERDYATVAVSDAKILIKNPIGISPSMDYMFQDLEESTKAFRAILRNRSILVSIGAGGFPSLSVGPVFRDSHGNLLEN